MDSNHLITPRTKKKRQNTSKEDILGYILEGPARIKIFTFLTQKPGYAYEIAEDIKLPPSTAIQILKEMLERNIVKCLNPRSYRRKYYELTTEALELKEKISQCVRKKRKI
ncbi:MAG: winged helix-turn-helix domain-containing protein [Candidatus Heimdallarchaeota archaeon]